MTKITVSTDMLTPAERETLERIASELCTEGSFTPRERFLIRKAIKTTLQRTSHHAEMPDAHGHEWLAACAPYLKDGETPAECIKRNRKDIDMLLTLLAREKGKTEAARSVMVWPPVEPLSRDSGDES